MFNKKEKDKAYSKDFKIEFAGRELIVEVGKYAPQTSGSCLVRYGGTSVLVTAVQGEEREGQAGRGRDNGPGRPAHHYDLSTVTLAMSLLSNSFKLVFDNQKRQSHKIACLLFRSFLEKPLFSPVPPS